MNKRRRRLLGMAVAGVGAAAAAGAAVAVERRVVRKRRAGVAGAEDFGSLRSAPVTVVADDGVALHAEVDEVSPHGEPGGSSDPGAATLVFVHGYALNLDCWHFQRAHFRGRRRMVFYDQRSHGRSARSAKENATIDQLGHDLRSVIDALVPEGPVVLVGHSMGGMSVMALAEHHPEMFGERVAVVALVSTTAGGLRSHKLFGPLLPEKVMQAVTPRVVAGLARAPELVDRTRRAGSNLGYLATDRLAFGEKVPSSYVEFVDEMLGQTSFGVLAEFFPNFDTLDKFSVLRSFERVPTSIICGTRDLLTAIGHSRKMASRIAGSRLVECPGAGHMVILECHERVNSALDALVGAAEAHTAGTRAS